jgi:hypothetical protein
VFTIARGVTVTLQDLTIRYGKTASFGGGLYNDFNSMMTLTSSIVANNLGAGNGGYDC